MSIYGRFNRYLIAIIMAISLGANLFLVIRLKTFKQKVANSSTLTSEKLESAVRDTMYSIKELEGMDTEVSTKKSNETDTKKTINDLQFSVQQLVLVFSNWIDLNQPDEDPDGPLGKGLGALETLRNTIVHHLGNQYDSNGKQLTNYDVVFLNRVYEKLDGLLTVYNNTEKHIDKIENIEHQDSLAICQWATGIEEISRLYRHSRTTNEHPEYMQPDSILAKIDDIFPGLRNFHGTREIEESVQIQDGVHYYEISYHHDDELDYLIRMDAIDGSLRLFEDCTEDYNSRLVSKADALNIAKNFMNELESYEDVIDSVSIVDDEDSDNTVYAFKFTPILDDTAIVSDCVNINVSSRGGNIMRYSSSFSNTEIPDMSSMVALKDVEDEYKEQFTDMMYNGLSVIRSFYTYYRPVIAYNYKLITEENTTELYFDVVTGNQVCESYSVYEPIHHTAADGCY